MSFTINLLDNLDYDEAETQLEGYIEEVTEKFLQSPEGIDHAKTYPEVGNWIYYFMSYGYRYEAFTPSKMTKNNVELVMESLLPRKVSIFNKSDADDAIPELVAFWSFLEREYQLKQAKSIITYLLSIKAKFPDWMMDPARGGLAKSFLMGGMAAGFDMTSQEGMNQFKDFYNAQLRGKAEKSEDKKKGFGTGTKTKPKSPRRKKK
jgi:hypothetical protein